MSKNSEQKSKIDPIIALANELGVRILSRSELPVEPRSFKMYRPPILLLRDVQQRSIVIRSSKHK